MTRRNLIALAAAIPAFADDQNSILGTGWGLDHIEIAVSSGEAAQETYFQKLGFTISPPTNSGPGRQHSMTFFGLPYLEFLWFGEPEASDPNPRLSQTMRRTLSKGGGIFQYNIDVSDVENVRDHLSGMGMKVTLAPSTRTVNGKEEPAPWRFLFATDDQAGTVPPPGVPGGGAVGFIEYRNNSDPGRVDRINKLMDSLPLEPRRIAGERNANTARSLRSVWVAVPDAAAAVKQCARFGFEALGKTRSSALQARGETVKCGEGSIEFWQPEDKRGPVASILSAQGPGPFGFSVGVASLQKAHEIVQEGVQTSLPMENRSGHPAFAVPAELTGGVWVEFVQQ